MKKLLLKTSNKALTLLGKQLVFTSCWMICHRPEVPQELLEK